MEDPAKTLESIAELIGLLLGNETAEAVSSLFANPMEFLRAPETVKAQLEDMMRTSSANFTESPENWLRLMTAFGEFTQLKARLQHEGKQELTSVVGKQCLEFLSVSRDVLGLEVFTAATAELDEVDTAKVLTPAIRLARQEPLGDWLFEPVAKEVADALNRAAECWYRPMLGAMFRLSQLRLQLEGEVSRELGTLMRQCRGCWESRGGPIAALREDIRVIRNSEAHRGTHIDVRASTITFVNHDRRNRERKIGPYDREHFATLVGEILTHCASIRGAFAALDR